MKDSFKISASVKVAKKGEGFLVILTQALPHGGGCRRPQVGTATHLRNVRSRVRGARS